MSQLLLRSGSQRQESFNTQVAQLHQAFMACDGIVFSETLCVPFADQASTEAGYFFDGEFEDHIQSVSQRFASQAHQRHARQQG